MTLAAKAHTGQSQKVYKWEDDVFDLSQNALDTITLLEAQKIAALIWRDYNLITAPMIKDGRGISFARANRYYIHLPRGGRFKGRLLHELAHSISMEDCGTKFKGEGFAGHGPAFVSLAIDLYERYLGISRVAMIALCKAKNIAFEN